MERRESVSERVQSAANAEFKMQIQNAKESRRSSF
jgi:hypothetical protein